MYSKNIEKECNFLKFCIIAIITYKNPFTETTLLLKLETWSLVSILWKISSWP